MLGSVDGRWGAGVKPAVFVMTDVVGSTALWESHGDVMRDALEVHDELVHGAVESAGGRVFKHTGDGMIAAFDEADGAVSGALDAVEALAGGAWGATGPLEVRVSVHAGTASERDGDYFGSPVNKVARINGVGHGGQVLVSDVARQLMSRPAGVDLGVHQLRDLLEPVRLWQLDDGDHGSLRTLKKARHNLPVMSTEFIGRQAEIDELRALFGHHRLVTITGVGGCGKTRLAVEVGAAMADKFPGGVWFADLTSERDGDKVGDRVNAALGVVEPLSSEHAGPVGVLDEATAGLATLVIVDNCEHLIDDVAEFAEAVLAQAPSASVLATSREALSVDGERVWRIPNLHDAAVELFVERATSAGVSGLEDYLDRIEEICVQLDDIPLAIELAAARVSSLSVDGLADRLDDRFSLLGGGRRRRRRQQTLQTMMDWSYGLLDPDEQHVLNQLAVFSGTFPLSGVAAVAAPSDSSVLDVLDSLVAQSLVVPSIDSGRYRLLETVRLYALERLIAADEVNATRDKHLAWISGLAGAAALTDRLSEPGDNWQDEIDKLAEIDNIVAAMEWAAQDNNPDALLDLFRGTSSCWNSSGTLGRVGASWRDRIPQPPGSEPVQRAGWLSASGRIDWNLGDYTRSIEQLLDAAEVVDALIDADADADRDWIDLLAAIWHRGLLSCLTGDLQAAMLDADRLDDIPHDPTGYAHWFSAQIRAQALMTQSTAESLAAAYDAVEISRSVSQSAYDHSVMMLGAQLSRVGRHEEAYSATRLGIDSPAMSESLRVTTVLIAARPLAAMGRFEEALDVIESDFGPMLETHRRNLRLHQLLVLVTALHVLDQIERRDRLAAISLQLAPGRGASYRLILVETLGSEEAVASLLEPDASELTPETVTALILNTINEIRELIDDSSLWRKPKAF
jgi:predicted ATPase/class 3 adenylate cyclase